MKPPVVPARVLKAFGFRKLRPTDPGHNADVFGDSWWNPRFAKLSGLYYSPHSHSVEQFAENLVNHVIFAAVAKPSATLASEIVNGVAPTK